MENIYEMTNKMKENQESQIRQTNRYHILGWVLFIICAIFFMASSLKNSDIWTFIGSILFLAACIVFLIPLLKSNKKEKFNSRIR
jgi:predicted membrane channel-forming protein YqfA (hemolysin III family)